MNLHLIRLVRAASAVAAVVLAAGCSTVVNAHKQKEPLVSGFLAGRMTETLSSVEDKVESRSGSGDELMWRLEAASVNFYAGEYRKSLQHFDQAEKLLADYDNRAVVSMRDASAEGGSALTNLNAIPYRGFCRDRVMIPVYKAFDYLACGDEEGYRVEIFRIREAQQKVVDRYAAFIQREKEDLDKLKSKNPEQAKLDSDPESLAGQNNNAEFKDSFGQMKQSARRGYGNFLNPLAVFLSGIGYSRDHDYENALVDFKRLYDSRPDSVMFQQYYLAALRNAGRPIPPALNQVKPFAHPIDRDTVYILFANGRSAAFKQIAIYFPVMAAWPMCEYYPAPYRTLQVSADGHTVQTSPLADMDGILSQEFEQLLPGIITRIVISTAVKEAATYTATALAMRENVFVGLGVYLFSTAYRATFNTADTRTWEFLPREFQLVQIPMPADRRLTLRPDGSGSGIVADIPPQAKSALVVVNAPAPSLLSCHVLNITQQ